MCLFGVKAVYKALNMKGQKDNREKNIKKKQKF